MIENLLEKIYIKGIPVLIRKSPNIALDDLVGSLFMLESTE